MSNRVSGRGGSAATCAVASIVGLGTAGGQAAPPANDDCSSAIVVTEGTVSGSTVEATNDGSATCGDSGTTADVWYLYTPPADGFLEVSACASSYNTVLGLWSGCPGEGAELVCNDNCCILQSAVSTLVDAGQDYYIRVAGWNGATGSYTLDIDLTTDYTIGPDVIYSNVTLLTHWGSVGDMHAYSLNSFTCNIGDLPLQWGDTTPLLAMNAYRLADGRLEQVGMSWVKNGTSAVATIGCGLPCGGEDGCVLGPGCRDAYTSSFNGIQTILGPRSEVNSFTGEYPGASGGEGDAIYKRLQIAESDLQTPDALYFVEGQYIGHDDAAAGNAWNNASYRRVLVGPTFDLSTTGLMHDEVPAIYAWQDHGGGADTPDPSVEIVEADVPGEGRFHVAAKATDLGGGQWRYDYAVHNLNSHRSAGAFSVPIAPGTTVSAVGFHDVDYHSGEPYDTTDWTPIVGPDTVRWTSPEPFAQNPNTNALRWATMYNFWFEADAGPTSGPVTIWLFRPGDPDSITARVPVPGPGCPADVNGDMTVNVQDLIVLILSWGPCPGCPADLDGDGEVEVPDLVQMIKNWGDCRG